MKTVNVKNEVYWVGVRDWNLREFHGYSTPRGSTYNAYLIMDEKITLVDGVKEYLSWEMIERVKSIVDFSKISYIVANHIEMDHSGNIPELMKLAPQAKIVTNNLGKKALEEHFDTTGWKYEIVKSGDTLNIGKRSLKFMVTPMLHWPDSMMTYSDYDKILFSNDGFGQHYATGSIWAKDEPFDIVIEEAKKYYANILFPYSAQANKALYDAKNLGLNIDIIANSHGCIFSGKKEVDTIISLYQEWANGEVKNRAVVVYDSMWNSTAKLASKIVEEFEDNNVYVVKRCLSSTHYSQVMIDILDAKYVVIGTPVLNDEIYPKVAEFLTYMKGLKPRNKVGFAFGSFGWSGKKVDEITKIFEELNWKTIPPFEEKYIPKEKDFSDIKEKIKKLINL